MGYCQSGASSLFSFVYSGPPTYFDAAAHISEWFFPPNFNFYEASSQTHARVCLLGDSKPSQVNIEDLVTQACLNCSINEFF